MRPLEQQQRETGVMQRPFNGYGFIQSDLYGDELFVKVKSILDGDAFPTAGSKVSFLRGTKPKPSSRVPTPIDVAIDMKGGVHRVCKAWALNGFCSRGDKCYFGHTPGPSTTQLQWQGLNMCFMDAAPFLPGWDDR